MDKKPLIQERCGSEQWQWDVFTKTEKRVIALTKSYQHTFPTDRELKKMIVSVLEIQPGTLRTHLSRIRKKIGVMREGIAKRQENTDEEMPPSV